MASNVARPAACVDSRTLGDPGSEDFCVDRYPFYLLNRAASRYNMVIGARLRSIGLDIPTWRVLMVLGERAPRSIGAIADASIIHLSTMMRMIGRMTAADLTTTAPSQDDARVTLVSLTDHGGEKLAQARRVAAPVYARLINGFSSAEFDGLLALIGRLQDNLDTCLLDGDDAPSATESVQG